MDKSTRRKALLKLMTQRVTDPSLGEQLQSNLNQLSNRIYGEAVGGYIPLPGEPTISHYLAELHTKGSRIGLPHINEGHLTFVEWTPGQSLACDANHCVVGEKLTQIFPQVLLVPFVGYTQHGFRLGRGKGLYDRYLDAHPDTLTIGVGFSDQQTEFVPEAHDKALNYIVTEGEILAF